MTRAGRGGTPAGTRYLTEEGRPYGTINVNDTLFASAPLR
jgi:hypothetical protein